jgi:hypothetical protein
VTEFITKGMFMELIGTVILKDEQKKINYQVETINHFLGFNMIYPYVAVHRRLHAYSELTYYGQLQALKINQYIVDGQRKKATTNQFELLTNLPSKQKKVQGINIEGEKVIFVAPNRFLLAYCLGAENVYFSKSESSFVYESFIYKKEKRKNGFVYIKQCQKTFAITSSDVAKKSRFYFSEQEYEKIKKEFQSTVYDWNDKKSYFNAADEDLIGLTQFDRALDLEGVTMVVFISYSNKESEWFKKMNQLNVKDNKLKVVFLCTKETVEEEIVKSIVKRCFL